jgi:phenylalanyl-tRNA synthetase beta chain
LRRLGLQPERLDGHRIEITVPSWRVDLEREADLVEEVARHLGYDRIPTHTDGLPTQIVASGRDALENGCRDVLAAMGFHEAFGYAMVADREDSPYVEPGLAEAIRLTNPIAETLACLRRSILPGLVKAADLNVRRGVKDVRLFEIGHVFLPGTSGGVPDEHARVGLIWTGAGAPRHWSQPDAEVDLQDVLGLTEHLVSALRPSTAFTREATDLEAFQPGQAALWRTPSGRGAAWAGALDPALEEELGQRAYLAEIDLEVLRGIPSETPTYRSLPKLTRVSRDLAVVVPAGTSYAEILSTLGAVQSPAPVQFETVDRYEGPPLAPGESALTVRATLSPSDRTLLDEEIDGYRRALIEALKVERGIEIRA